MRQVAAAAESELNLENYSIGPELQPEAAALTAVRMPKQQVDSPAAYNAASSSTVTSDAGLPLSLQMTPGLLKPCSVTVQPSDCQFLVVIDSLADAAACRGRPEADPAADPEEPTAACQGRGLKYWLLEPVVKLGELCNLRKTWQKFHEQLREIREAGRNPGAQLGRAAAESPEAAGKIVAKRLFAALAFSEVIGTYMGSLAVSTALQYLMRSGYAGVAGSIIGDYFPAVAAFAAAWICMNRDRYREGLWRGIGRYLREAGPIHAACLAASFFAYTASGTISSACVWLLNRTGEQLGNYVPAFLTSQPVNMVIGEAIFLAIMIKAFNKKLAPSLTARLLRERAAEREEPW